MPDYSAYNDQILAYVRRQMAGVSDWSIRDRVEQADGSLEITVQYAVYCEETGDYLGEDSCYFSLSINESGELNFDHAI